MEITKFKTKCKETPFFFKDQNQNQRFFLGGPSTCKHLLHF